MKEIVSTGDIVDINKQRTIASFKGKRKVLSTAAFNGGLSENLKFIFNFNDSFSGKCEMLGNTMEEHQKEAALVLGLDKSVSTGLTTAANPENSSIVTLKHEDFSVTALVTAGVEINGCRVCDPAPLHEKNGQVFVVGGTVNIILFVDVNLTDNAMIKASIVSTEAKCAAMQELMVASRYSEGLATGSGTDGMIIISNSESKICLGEAGTQFVLGEYIGKAVKTAVTEALFKETGLDRKKQYSIFRRTERFGITLESLWEDCKNSYPSKYNKGEFFLRAEKVNNNSSLIPLITLYVHLMDEFSWGLLSEKEAFENGREILKLMAKKTKAGLPEGGENMKSYLAQVILKMILSE